MPPWDPGADVSGETIITSDGRGCHAGVSASTAAALKTYDEMRGAPQDWNHYIGPRDSRASYTDLHADVDALVLGYATTSRSCTDPPAPAGWSKPHRMLSKAIADYYATATSGPSQYRAARVQCLADMLGANPADVQSFGLQFGPVIYELAQPYYLTQNGGSAALLPSVQSVLRERSRTAAELFAAWLNAQ